TAENFLTPKAKITCGGNGSLCRRIVIKDSMGRSEEGIEFIIKENLGKIYFCSGSNLLP
ncbi:hypothetical protein HMPREF9225_0099, partial [Peptoniphilus duerdenii ATCC BAA-1640]